MAYLAIGIFKTFKQPVKIKHITEYPFNNDLPYRYWITVKSLDEYKGLPV